MLKEADIVVTNPPFSLFREYIAQLVAYKKKFLIIGNINSISCKEIYPLFAQNKVWLGPSISSGDRKFNVPDDYPLNAASCGTDENGRRFIRVKGVRWLTNLDHKKRHEDLILVCRYCPEEYPVYDNYAAIHVQNTLDIPCDYKEAMGVPITFLDKYNPDQFDIIGITDNDFPAKELLIKGCNRYDRPYLNGERKIYRLIIRHTPPKPYENISSLRHRT